ncbi:hypothetical protein ABLE68_03255 [Nocardioides sp. CN2-186]|uniref:hypothetical protein n=1 Tax=Nocardioides tweenelious TaxID=3156607 RepID=UPI0032B44BC3
MRIALLPATLALLASIAVVPPVSAAAPTCQGQPATLVGTPGHALRGTSGPDVIVTNGATPVRAGDGDDRVCITGHRASFPDISAGPGDDRVRDTSRAFPDVDLGAGDDWFRELTTHGADVDAGDAAGLGHDVIIGGPWADSVVSGVPDQPNDDVVRLGPGGDGIHLNGTPTGSFDGGGGHDIVLLVRSAPADWVLDLAQDTGTVDGAPFAIRHIEDFALADLPWRTMHVIGSDAGESVYATRTRTSGPVSSGELTAQMGGGNDLVSVTAAQSGPFRGSAGSDRIEVEATDGRRQVGPDVHVDLSRDRYRVDGDDPITASSFESAETRWFGSSTVIGTSGDNRLDILGCQGRAEAHAGDDFLQFDRSRACGGPARDHQEFRASGGPGDDILWGDRGMDRLYGGPGLDQAWGLEARDTCRAERMHYCEA